MVEVNNKNISSDFFEKLLESFGSKTRPIGRNDICYCGSGKKYKKCCEAKNREPAALVSLNFEIAYEPFDEASNPNIPLSDEDQKRIEEIFHMITSHPDQARSRSDEYKTALHLLIEKYPLKASLWNHLAIVHSICSEEKQMEEVICETVNRFPDYLFGLTGLAMIYIRKGEVDKAFEILKQSQSLPQLYPHRNKFHFTEVEAFHHALVHYNCAVDQLNAAEVHLSFLEEISTQNNLLKSATQAVQLCRMKRNLFSGLDGLIREAQGQKKPPSRETHTCHRDG